MNKEFSCFGLYSYYYYANRIFELIFGGQDRQHKYLWWMGRCVGLTGYIVKYFYLLVAFAMYSCFHIFQMVNILFIFTYCNSSKYFVLFVFVYFFLLWWLVVRTCLWQFRNKCPQLCQRASRSFCFIFSTFLTSFRVSPNKFDSCNHSHCTDLKFVPGSYFMSFLLSLCSLVLWS